MFVRITNSPRDYAWGSARAISDLLGRVPSGRPEAELWLGAHAGSPSTILNPLQVGGYSTLAEWIAAAPQAALGAELAASTSASGGARLPFLLKVLAAARPLSLQVHPSSARAAASFELESAEGVPIDSAERNYRDPFHKPELIFALSETFEALCGFRNQHEIRDVLAALRALDAVSPDPHAAALDALESRLDSSTGLHGVVEWLLRDQEGSAVTRVVEHVVALSNLAASLAEGGTVVNDSRDFETVRTLAESNPGDPGIVMSLLLNRVTLKRGEALFLPAGIIHAYLSGLGIELMAASDNVLRGGLTPKHVDVDELLDVVDFGPIAIPYLDPEVDSAAGVNAFSPGIADFELVHIEAAEDGAYSGPGSVRQLAISGPGIALCTAGEFRIEGATSSVYLRRGESVYITPDERNLTLAGSGEVFLALPGH